MTSHHSDFSRENPVVEAIMGKRTDMTSNIFFESLIIATDVGQSIVVTDLLDLSAGLSCFFFVQFIALGTFDGTIKLLDHTGTFLKDRDYTVVIYS